MTRRDIKTTELRAKFDGEKPERTLADIDRELGEIAKGEEKVNTYATLLRNYENMVAGIEKIRAQIAELETKIREHPAPAPDEAERAQLTTQIDGLHQQIATLEADFNTREQAIKQGKTTLDKLNTSYCPLYKDLVCQTDKTIVRNVLEVMQSSMLELQGEHPAKLKALTDRQAAIAARITTLDKQTRDYAEYRRMHDLDKLDAGVLDELLCVITDTAVLDRYDHIFLAMVDHDDAMAVLDRHRAAVTQIIRL